MSKKATKRLVLFSLLGILLIIGRVFKYTTPIKNPVQTEQIAEKLPIQEIDSAPIIVAVAPSGLEFPAILKGEKLIQHTAYSLVYSEQHEQAKWVAYLLTKNETNSLYERSNRFIVDPLISSTSADDGDYKKSGYDRGHLAPAGDMGWSSTAMRESFYYSNMSPQEPSLNRGIWKELEELVRTWAREYDSLYVVTGPVLENNLPTIGFDKVSVPKYYYKVLLDYSGPETKAIGFVLPNEKSNQSLSSFSCSVDEVERITGIDFFCALPDSIEDHLEKNQNDAIWIWKSEKSTQNKSKKSASSSTEAVQCSGTTKKGNRCKNRTKNPSGYCYLHEN